MMDRKEFYNIKIENESSLTEKGFTEFSLPFKRNATRMVVHNTDKTKMLYPEFYRRDLDKTVQSVAEAVKTLVNDLLIDKKTADDMVVYFRNACYLLQEDPTNHYFFKNGKAVTHPKQASLEGIKKALGEQLFSNFLDDIIYWTVISQNPLKLIGVSKKLGCICKLSVSYTDSNNSNASTKKAHLNYGSIFPASTKENSRA